MRKTLALTLFVTGCGALEGFDLDPQAFMPPNLVALDASRFEGERFVPGELVVKVKPQASTRFMNFSRRYGLSHKQRLANGAMVMTARTPNVEQVAAELTQSGLVAYAEPNFIGHIPEKEGPNADLGRMPTFFPMDEGPAPFSPNDDMYAKQYAPKITKAPEGWALFDGDPNFVLAIVDSGVDVTHPDLATKIVPGFDVVDNDDTPVDDVGHGTHCAGIASAITNNGLGIAGFAPKAKIMPVRVLDSRGSGTSASVAQGLIWAVDHGAKVINTSLGFDSPAKVLEDAVNYALSKNVLLVSTMGNRYGRIPRYPASFKGVLAVGATDANDKKADYSNWGDWISVSAPGSDIISTLPLAGSMMGKEFGFASGTSMAAPAVTGLVALVRAKYPALTVPQVKQLIEKSADDLGEPGFDEKYGHGRINVEKSLKAADLIDRRRR